MQEGNKAKPLFSFQRNTKSNNAFFEFNMEPHFVFQIGFFGEHSCLGFIWYGKRHTERDRCFWLRSHLQFLPIFINYGRWKLGVKPVRFHRYGGKAQTYREYMAAKRVEDQQ